jgi:hypothetical protein
LRFLPFKFGQRENFMEHRCGNRKVVNALVLIRSRAGVVGQATLCEVSASGAKLVSSLPLAIHSVVVVQIAPRETQRGRQIEVEAEVVRRTESGFAVEWIDFAPEAFRLLYSAADSASSQIQSQTPQKHPRSRRQ